MKSRPPRKLLFERLQQGLTEGIREARGEMTLRTVVLPDHPPEITPEDLTALRVKLEMSREVFARVLSVSPRTVQGWEQGNRKPSSTSRRLIQVIHENPSLVFKAVGMPAPRKSTTGKVEKPSSGKRQPV
jgi:putative transcriptional regulator